MMDPKTAQRMRQPMSRGETHVLMQRALQPILDAMNELEGRLKVIEASREPERSPSGLVLPR